MQQYINDMKTVVKYFHMFYDLVYVGISNRGADQKKFHAVKYTGFPLISTIFCHLFSSDYWKESKVEVLKHAPGHLLDPPGGSRGIPKHGTIYYTCECVPRFPLRWMSISLCKRAAVLF